MAIVNFPANPTIGDQYNENGITYTWNGAAWTANGAENTDARYVQVTGDTMTGDLTVPSLNGGPLAGLRNRFTNGNMQVVQRGAAGQAGVTRVYTCDRWYVHSGASESFTWDQIDATGDQLAAGFAKVLRIRNSSATYQIRQLVELPGAGLRGEFTEGSVWTFSIYSNAALDIQFDWRVDAVGAGAVTAIQSWAAMTDEGGGRYSYTLTLPAIAPDPTALALCVAFRRTDQTTSSIQVSGAQFEPGPVCTPFEARPIGTELALCQRYLRVVGVMDPPASTARTLPGISGVKTSNTAGRMTFDSSGMRTTPTPSVDVEGSIGDLAIVAADGTSALTSIASPSGRDGVIYFVANFNNSGATNSSLVSLAQAGAGVRLLFSAEL